MDVPSPDPLRVLLLADTHLGFDRPLRPRSDRPRRGPDFFANAERALRPARAGEVDLVIHGGDLLYRSKVPAKLVDDAMGLLRAVADAGTPVVVVPGNHERSRIPFPLLALHPGIHVVDRPRTLRFELRGRRLAVAGFPFRRQMAAGGFARALAETGWDRVAADARLLCMHQAVEGAQVGRHDFTFRWGEDVIPAQALPRGVDAVLSGHIHRHQVLRRDLRGRTLPAPVIYPGSTERTSRDEIGERKGYVIVELAGGGAGIGWRFVELPLRPLRWRRRPPAWAG